MARKALADGVIDAGSARDTAVTVHFSSSRCPLTRRRFPLSLLPLPLRPSALSPPQLRLLSPSPRFLSGLRCFCAVGPDTTTAAATMQGYVRQQVFVTTTLTPCPEGTRHTMAMEFNLGGRCARARTHTASQIEAHTGRQKHQPAGRKKHINACMQTCRQAC
jgi:hypothetical protein